jgi:hypothetical protein
VFIPSIISASFYLPGNLTGDDDDDDDDGDDDGESF